MRPPWPTCAPSYAPCSVRNLQGVTVASLDMLTSNKTVRLCIHLRTRSGESRYRARSKQFADL